MKNLILCIAFLCSTTVVFAQNESNGNALIIKLPTTTLFNKVVAVKEIEIPHKTQPEVQNDITSEDWDTSVYNPYLSTLVQFPIQLLFTDSTYASPVLHKKVITSRYGWRRGRGHQGIDIDLATGDSVVSVLDGIVRFASYSYGHGNTVVVRHFNGLETTYAHLSHIAVKPNDSIAKGGYLGKGGNTGNSRGSHLHFVTRYKGETIHPEYLFDFSPSNAIRAKELWVTQQWAHPRFHNSRRASDIEVLTSEDAALAHVVEKKKIYVVRKGDTLYGISKKNNLAISEICNSNGIKKTQPLKVGQKLILELL